MVSANLPKHTCSSCGFLAVQVPSDESEVGKAGLTYRTTGGHSTDFAAHGPMCYVLAQRIDQEAQSLKPDGMVQTAKNVKAVIQKPRSDCIEWKDWIPWLSSKEHREMRDRARETGQQKRMNWIHLGVAAGAAIASAAGIVISAVIVLVAANKQADATIEAARMQINEQRQPLTTPLQVPPSPTPSTSGPAKPPP